MSKENKNRWAIVDFNTGAADGFYVYKEHAEGALKRFKKRGAIHVCLVEMHLKEGEKVFMSNAVAFNMGRVGFSGMENEVKK